VSWENNNGRFPKVVKRPVPQNGALFDPEAVRRRGIWNPVELVKSEKCCFCYGLNCREVVAREDGLVINECLECGLAFLNPRPSPSQLAEYYSDGYFNGSKDFFRGKDYCLERDKSIHAGAVTGYNEILANFDIEDKTVLDVGCASGALLYLLRERRTREVVGIDSAEYPISFGVAHYGLDLRCSALETAQLPGAYFDLITLIDVIEHVEDINTFLGELRRVLKPGGQIFIITPNYLAYALARHQWMCLYKDFEHLQYFSEQSLRSICARMGWSINKCWTDSGPFRIYEYPRLYRVGLHRLLHPQVALRNGLAERKFKRAASLQSPIGANLNAILRQD
jgi:2-polyprenyl-3-methyl-5-hydroxy-6-metoxy-1,4-benzoquinol methylase